MEKVTVDGMDFPSTKEAAKYFGHPPNRLETGSIRVTVEDA